MTEPDFDKLAVTIHNERLKLLATFLNGIGISVFAVGGLAPVFSSLYNSGGPTLFLMLVSIVCFFDRMYITLLGKHGSQKDEAMTTMEMISLLLMPVAGLIIAGTAVYLVNHHKL